jgi:phosphoglycolate phosphatase-like HAD superfamily hydrolase
MYKNLIFDMDDTLIHCGRYYVATKNRFVEFQHQRTGLPKDMILKMLNDVDLACTTFPMGFSKERFPRSFVAISHVLDIVRGLPVNEAAAKESLYIGQSVFDAEYEPFEGAFETLKMFKDNGFKLFLNTKGDEDVQNMKIFKHKLDRFFDDDSIYIVPKKDRTGIIRILDDHNLKIEETLSIGDSVRDDIGTAKAVGIDTALVTEADHTWGYEDTDHEPTYEIHSIRDLLKIIPINPTPLQATLADSAIRVARMPKWQREALQAHRANRPPLPDYDQHQ